MKAIVKFDLILVIKKNKSFFIKRKNFVKTVIKKCSKLKWYLTDVFIKKLWLD